MISLFWSVHYVKNYEKHIIHHLTKLQSHLRKKPKLKMFLIKYFIVYYVIHAVTLSLTRNFQNGIWNAQTFSNVAVPASASGEQMSAVDKSSGMSYSFHSIFIRTSINMFFHQRVDIWSSMVEFSFPVSLKSFKSDTST